MLYFSKKSRTLLVAAFVATLSAGVLIAQQQRNISGLIGRTDDNLNLYVRGAAAGAAGQSSNIGGLVGRTDANLNLYVTFDGTVPNTMGTGLFADGTALLPGIAFASEPSLGLWRNTANQITATGTFFKAANFASAGSLEASSAGAIYWLARGLMKSPADGVFTLSLNGETIGSRLKVDALPTIASGFGTSPSVTAGSTPLAGSVDVGTGGAATSGVITFNGTAFPSAPFCVVSTNSNASAAAATFQVVSTTTNLTISSWAAWAANAKLSWLCISAK